MGNKKSPPNFKDLSGEKFNKWTVLKRSGSRKRLNKVESIWECLCECGKIGNITTGNLKSGVSKSCGCLRTERVRIYRKKNRENEERQQTITVQRIYGNYKNRAFKNKFDFNLSIEEFYNLIIQPCFYCGRKEVQITKNVHGDKLLKHNGIDRKDPIIGYIIDNCVPCCKTCNYGKNNLTINEWNDYLDKLVAFRVLLKK